MTAGRCHFCKGLLKEFMPYRYKTDEFRQIYPAGFIYECNDCRLRQVDVSSIDDNELTKYYKNVYRHVAGISPGGSEYHRRWYESRADALWTLAQSGLSRSKTTRVFEVGAGYGFNLMRVARDCPGSELFTDEVDATTAAHATGIRQGDLSDGPFDLIIISHVLEHFRFPRQVLEMANSSLSEGGVLVIEVPNETVRALNGQAFHEPHISFFEHSTLTEMLQAEFGTGVQRVFAAGPSIGGLAARTWMGGIKEYVRSVPLVSDLLRLLRDSAPVDFTVENPSGIVLRCLATKV